MTKEQVKALLEEQRKEMMEEYGKLPDSENKEKATQYAKAEWLNVKKAFNFLEDNGIEVPDEVRANYFKYLESEKLAYIVNKQEREASYHVPVALR